jgi:hypothetical protein
MIQQVAPAGCAVDIITEFENVPAAAYWNPSPASTVLSVGAGAGRIAGRPAKKPARQLRIATPIGALTACMTCNKPDRYRCPHSQTADCYDCQYRLRNLRCNAAWARTRARFASLYLRSLANGARSSNGDIAIYPLSENCIAMASCMRTRAPPACRPAKTRNY